MSEVSNPRPPELTPGTIIEFGDITELSVFEDAIAPYVEPKYRPGIWAARLSVDELLRPRVKGRLFYGRLNNVTLTTMADPYDRLLDAYERGWKMSRGVRGVERTGLDAEQLTARYLGFEFSAEAFTTGLNSAIGLISAELWYYPMPRFISKKAGTTATVTHTNKSGKVRAYSYVRKQDSIDVVRATGETIRRIVTKPKYEADKFIEIDERSRRIGFELARKALLHPIHGNFESKRRGH